MEGNNRDLIQGTVPEFIHDIRFPGQDLKPGPPE